MHKSTTLAAGLAKEATDALETIAEVVKVEQVTGECLPDLSAQLKKLEGLRSLRTNLMRSQGTSTQVAEVLPKLSQAGNELSSWMGTVLCPSSAEIFAEIAKHVESLVVPSEVASNAAGCYGGLKPKSFAPAVSEEFLIFCSLAWQIGSGVWDMPRQIRGHCQAGSHHFFSYGVSGLAGLVRCRGSFARKCGPARRQP